MAPLPSVPNVLRVRFITADDASISAGSRFFLKYTGGPPNSTDCNNIASGVAAGWASHVAAIVLSSEHLTSVIVQDLSSDTGAVGTWSGDSAGGMSGTALPASACAVVNHQIARSYRGGRPRTYLRCGDTSFLSGTNEWSTGSLTSILDAWQAWISGILSIGDTSITLTDIVNVSYYQSFLPHEYPSGRYKNIPQLRKVDGVATPLVDNITNSTVATKLGSQRRRLNL